MPAILAAMRKTLQFAALSYMKYALQPWGSMIAVGELLHGQMTKITFEPIEFSPGNSVIENKQKEYLDKLSSLMKKTPRLDLTVCGVATARDKIPAKPDPKQAPATKDAKQPAPKEPSNEELLLLATHRADAVKQYLIKDKQIAPDRIHNCNPIYQDDQTKKPVVELVL